jgi:hypothetical protein
MNMKIFQMDLMPGDRIRFVEGHHGMYPDYVGRVYTVGLKAMDVHAPAECGMPPSTFVVGTAAAHIFAWDYRCPREDDNAPPAAFEHADKILELEPGRLLRVMEALSVTCRGIPVDIPRGASIKIDEVFTYGGGVLYGRMAADATTLRTSRVKINCDDFHHLKILPKR